MKRLKELRTLRGLTQEEFGKKIGQSKSNISKYENNILEPNMQTLNLMANFFDVSVYYLIGNTDNPNSEITLTDKDEKDIAKTMQKLKEQLSNDQGLMFDGDVLDEETAKLLLAAIEQQERMIKKINKKYTPKKYRK